MSAISNASVPIAMALRDVWMQSLPLELKTWLTSHLETRKLAAGQLLFGRGDAPNGLFCVVQGTIRITGMTQAGDEALLVLLDAPHWFGEIALFDNDVRTHDAWAESDVVLLHVSQALLHERLVSNPVDWRYFGLLLAQKIRVAFTSMEELVMLAPTARLAKRLGTMAAGYGAWSGRDARVLKISQAQLALMLSLTRQTINQSLKELESVGAIRRGRGSIEVIDLTKFQ